VKREAGGWIERVRNMRDPISSALKPPLMIDRGHVDEAMVLLDSALTEALAPG
jgi:hypothetical protein